MSGPHFETYDVLGVPVSATTLQTASDAIHVWARDRKGRIVFIRDVHGIMQAQEDVKLLELHHRADLVTPDGMPLVWLGKLDGKLVSRTCGPDLIEKVISDSETSGIKHYLYGGLPGVAEDLKSVFAARFPNAQVVGVGTPPFRPLTSQELDMTAKEIEDAKADVVWIGISTPKQEWLMADLSMRVGATFIGVGAAFDFHTGRVKRAPNWMRNVGLEWSWRLASEPRRLWRRYLLKAPRFAVLISKSRLNRKTSSVISQ